MSFDSPNTNKKLTSSFSSPEFTGNNQEQSVLSTDSTLDSIATNASTSVHTESVKIIKSFNSATRDSGFGDSTLEDTSSSSKDILLTRTEHYLTSSNSSQSASQNKSTDIVLHTKIINNNEKSKLKSVEEDIDVYHPIESLNQDTSAKESNNIITIVTTTKVTTKVEKIKNKSKSKNNKKKSKNQKNELVKSQSESSGELKEINQESLDESLNNQSQVSEPSVFKVDIKKSTEELVYEPINTVVSNINQEPTDLTVSNETKPSEQQLVDLNSTVLDCEDILSTYSNNNQNNPSSPRHVETEPVVDSINEVVNVVDVLSDVTHSLINKTETQQEEKIETKPTEIVVSSPQVVTVNLETESKKKKKFKLFSRLRSKTRENKDESENLNNKKSNNTKRKLDTKTTNPSSPSKHQKIEKLFHMDKFELLNSDEKDRILYMKQECIDLILNNLNANNSSAIKNLSNLIGRSLDLLRHDRVESFDKLSKQLIDEHNIHDETESKSVNYVFNNLVRNLILDEKILLKLNLDKKNSKPCEEKIEFENLTSSEWSKKFNFSANSETKLENNLISKSKESVERQKEEIKQEIIITETLIEKSREEMSSSKVVEESFMNQVEAKLLETNEKENKVEVEENNENNSHLNVENQQQSNSNSNCGTTPPSTPQNEVQATLCDNKKIELNNSGDGARIILNTIKEPPILFPSDYDPSLKQTLKQDVKSEVKLEPKLDTVQAIERKESKSQKPKKTKPKKSSLSSCLSCTGASKLSDDEETKSKKPIEREVLKPENLCDIPTLITLDLDKPKTETKPEVKTEKKENEEKTENLITASSSQQENLNDPNKFVSLDTDDSKSTSLNEPNKLEETEIIVEISQTTVVEVKNEPAVEEQEKLESADKPLEQIEEEKSVTNLEVSETPEVQKQDSTESAESSNLEQTKKLERQESVDSSQEPENNENTEKQNNKKKKKKKKNKKGKEASPAPVEIFVEPVVDLKQTETEIKVELEESKAEPVNEKTEIEVPLSLESTEIKIEIEKPDKDLEILSEKVQAMSSFAELVSASETDNTIEIKIENEAQNEQEAILIENKSENIVSFEKVEILSSKTITETVIEKTNVPENVEIKIESENEPIQLEINREIKIEFEQKPAEVIIESILPEAKKPDIVKLEVVKPEPVKVDVQVKPVTQVETQVTKKSDKKSKKQKDHDDDGSKVSCFSCKAKKADKAKKSAKQEPVVPHTTTDPKPNTNQTITKAVKEIDKKLFVGLDSPAKDEQNEDQKAQAASSQATTLDNTNLEVEAPNNEKNITPSLIGSTSFEANGSTEVSSTGAKEEPNEDANKPLEQVSDTVQSEEPIKQEMKEESVEPETQTVIEVEIQKEPEQKTEEQEPVKQKVLSNDIVKLPDPVEQTQVQTITITPPPVVIEQKKEVQANKQTKKEKKSSSLSCFSGKKSSKKLDKTQPPVEKPDSVKTEVKIEDSAKTNWLKKENVPPEQWAVGLDRAEGDTIIRKDPEGAEIQVVKSEPVKQLTTINIEVPSVIDPNIVKVEKEEKLTKLEEKTPAESEKSKIIEANLTIDSPGAIIRIDRKADHAFIPDMTKDRVTNAKTVSTEATEQKHTTKIESKKSEKKAKKTSVIDLPLINILSPRDAKTKTSKQKNKKEDKKPEQAKVETESDPKTINVKQTVVGTTLVTTGLDKPEVKSEELIEKETKVDITIPKELEIKEINVDVKLETPPVVESKEEVETKTPEINIAITQVTEVYQTEENNEITETKIETVEEQKQEEQIQVVEERVSETVVEPVSEKVEELKKEISSKPEITEEKVLLTPELPPVDLTITETKLSEVKPDIIILERTPDVVVLPEIDLTTRNKIEKKPETVVQVKKDEPQAETKEEKKPKTSFIDLPLIDILVPKEAKTKKAKKEKKSKKVSEPVPKETKKQAETKIYIDMPVVDLIVPDIKVEEPKEKVAETQTVTKSVALQEKDVGKKSKKSEKASKTTIIDMPLIDVLVPKAEPEPKQNSSETISCFSSKSKEKQKLIKKSEQSVPKPTEPESKKEPEPVKEITIENITVEEPKIAEEQIEPAKSVEQDQNLQVLSENIQEVTSFAEIVSGPEKKEIAESTPVETEIVENTENKIEQEPEQEQVKEEAKIETEDKLETVEPIVELELTPAEVIIESNLPEAKKPDIVKLEVVKPEPVKVDVQVKPVTQVETQVTKKSDKKSKKQKDQDDDGSKVSCFSCKAKKADKAKKSVKQEPVKQEPLKVLKEEKKENKEMIQPEIKHQSTLNPDLFKGLDKPSSYSIAEHIIEQQTFLDTGLVKTVETKLEIVQRVEQETETVTEITNATELIQTEAQEVKSETREIEQQVPVEIEAPITVVELNIEPIQEQAVQEPTKIEIETEKVKEIEINDLIPPDLTVKVDLPSLNQPVNELILPNAELQQTEEQVLSTPVLPVPEQLAAVPEQVKIETPIILPETITVEAPIVNIETKAVSPTVQAKVPQIDSSTKQQKGSKLSCLICGSNKKSKDKKITKEIISKPVELKSSTNNQKQLPNPVILIDSTPLDAPEQQVPVDLKTPPKKPPRGHLDTSIVVDESQNLDSLQTDTFSSLKEEQPNQLKEASQTVETKQAIVEVVLPVIPSQDQTKQTETESKKESKKNKTHTSIIDLPLIDILVPKEAKIKQKKDKQAKKENQNKQVDKQETVVSNNNSIPQQVVEIKTPEIDRNLFKGLDSDRIIKSSEQTNYVLDIEKIEVKGTSIDLNQPDVELFVNNEEPAHQQTKPVETKQEETQKEEKAQKAEPKTIELPISTEVEYISKKVDSWTTDPLPHVQIGLHKIGDQSLPVKSTTSTQDQTVPVLNGVNKQVEIPSSYLVDVQKSTNDKEIKLTDEDKKILKLKRDQAIDYLKFKSGYKLEQLIEHTTKTISKKELKSKEKLADKLYKRIIKLIIKTRAKPLTYSELSKKLEKLVPSKTGSTDIEKCVNQLRLELENGSLITSLRDVDRKLLVKPEDKKLEASTLNKEPVQDTTDSTKPIETKTKTESVIVEKQETESNEDKVSLESNVVRRFPNLTWREANERARILFYKGRTPSIHYNEKRDSFHVSMLTQIITNGKEKLTEVPVSDDDVRRLLNSCGLYWDGESISLLNKSDEIFSNAQQEAFDLINLITNSNQNETNLQPVSEINENDNNREQAEESKINYIY